MTGKVGLVKILQYNGGMIHQKRYLELDALRGFAAVFVMFFHYTEGKNAWSGFDLGVSGVDLFFLISGFVIFMSINKVSSGREFVINRAARLYPTYWACVTFTFGVIILLRLIHFNLNHAREVGFIDYAANLTMFQYYLHIPDIDVPYWTMIIEMLFYLLILFLYETKLLKYIIVIGCLLNVYIIIDFVMITLHYIPNYSRYFPLLNHFALFFGGIIFYQLMHGMISKLKGYIIISFCLLTQIIIYRFAGSDPAHISLFQYIGMLLLYFTLFILFVNGKLKFIISKPAVFLGKISFALYLIHNYVFRGVIGLLERRFNIPFLISTLGVTVPIVILLAYLITVYIEKPYGKKMKVFLNDKFNNKNSSLKI
ncbi:acyltransferase family protein [Mucilaginibacter segetis]|uniref:Acyltransferase n=1 Tax=Mucilaginibacter segetis TaxID=2793071 RepID=A0A934PSW7_9SPHI|nr:acyltransferase [Mucilaginibacter segetis]MBK0380209.1 acyltransferase [Mucilaginibacter segetis]